MNNSLGDYTPGSVGTDSKESVMKSDQSRAPQLEYFWNLPNTITTLRMAAIPVLLAFPLFDGPKGSFVVGWIFILAATTDVLDGWLARRGQQVTSIGKLLDPLADKLLVTVCLVVLLAIERVPIWATPLVVVIIGRELAVTGLRGIASQGGRVMASDWRGKAKSFAQNVAITALIFPDPTLELPTHRIGLALLAVATVLTLWSGYTYFAEYFGRERKGNLEREEN